MRQAIFKPTVPSTAWPKVQEVGKLRKEKQAQFMDHFVSGSGSNARQHGRAISEDEYGLNTIGDSEILKAVEDADQYERDEVADPISQNGPSTQIASKSQSKRPLAQISEPNPSAPEKLSNGRYKCKHACKDKTKCKHLCCREGLDRPPKDSKKGQKANEPPTQHNITNVKCQRPKSQQVYGHESQIDAPDVGPYTELDLSNSPPKPKKLSRAPALRALQALHDKAQTHQPSTSTLDPVYPQLNSELPFLAELGNDNEPTGPLSRPALTSQQTFSQFDGDGFKKLAEFSDLSSLEEVNDADVFDIGNLEEDYFQEKTANGDTQPLDDDANQALEDDFGAFVDWDDDFVQVPEVQQPAEEEKGKIESQTTQNVSKHFSNTPVFKKRPFLETESSTMFLNRPDNDSSTQRPMKRPKLAELSVPLRRSGAANASVCVSGAAATGMATNKKIMDAENMNNSEGQTGTSSDADDLAFLLREFGTCVEFV